MKNVELMRRAFEAVSRRDLAAFLDAMDPDVVAVPRIVAFEGDALHGHEGIRTWWDAIFGAFPEFRVEVLAVRGGGDATVAHVLAHGRGQGSGAPFEDDIWVASRIRAGKAVWWQTFRSRDEALAAAGLRE